MPLRADDAVWYRLEISRYWAWDLGEYIGIKADWGGWTRERGALEEGEARLIRDFSRGSQQGLRISLSEDG